MILYDEDTLYNGEVCIAIGAQDPLNDEAFIEYIQPHDDKMYAQKAHDSALDHIFEEKEDLMTVRKELGPEEGQ